MPDDLAIALDLANARLDATITALRDVMRTLRHAAGSPHEQQVYARAREVLALSGRVEDAEVAEYQAAYERWASEVEQREKQCKHLTGHNGTHDGSLRCSECGKRLFPREGEP